MDSQPSSCNGNGSNCNSPKTFLDGCGAVNHASVPKKLRSAIKKRGRESIAFSLPIPKKKHHTSNGVNTLRKDGTKKSKLKTKKRHITKDEEEVAEALYALAGMFADAKETDQPGFDREQPETKSSAIPEEGDSINAAEGEESGKTISQVMIEDASQSSTANVLKSQYLGVQQPKLEPTTPGFEPDLSLCSRPPVSILGTAPLGEGEIDLEQEGVSGVQYGTDDKCNDKFLSSATGAPSSETQKSCSRFPAWLESTVFSSQPRVIENSFTTEKEVQYAPISKNPWKRSTAHVYISRLIKVLQISKTKGLLPEKPAQLTACGQPRVNQIPVVNSRNSGVPFSGIPKDSSEIQTDILLHKRPVQDQQMAHDFLSLVTGESVNKDPPRVQYNAPYMQSQDHSAMLFPLPQNGHSTFHSHNSAFPIQQVSRYQGSYTGQQLQPQYNNSNGRRESACVLNYTHALFPHLNAALSAKYQQLLPSQLQPLNNTRHQHQLPLAFDRNHPENIQQLQLQLQSIRNRQIIP